MRLLVRRGLETSKPVPYDVLEYYVVYRSSTIFVLVCVVNVHRAEDTPGVVTDPARSQLEIGEEIPCHIL